MKQIVFLVMLIGCVSSVFSMDKIVFSKTRNYHLGKGVKVHKSFLLTNSDSYSYDSLTDSPFKMVKKKGGVVDFIFDASLLEEDDLEDGKTYQKYFFFTKKNIGKRYSIKVSAIYKTSQTLKFKFSNTDTLKLTLSPQKLTKEILIESSYESKLPFKCEYNAKVLNVSSSTKFKLIKGSNIVNVKVISSNKNFEEVINLKFEGKELFVLVKGSGFTSSVSSLDTVSSDNKQISPTNIANKDLVVSSPETNHSSSLWSSFNLILYGVIGFLLLLVLILFFALIKRSSGNGANCERYSLFFHDVAQLLNVDIKGRSIDDSIDEMVIKIMEFKDNNPVSVNKGYKLNNEPNVDKTDVSSEDFDELKL